MLDTMRSTRSGSTGRLRNMSPSQAEYTVARTYVEWLCDLPWSTGSIDKIDLQEVRDILVTTGTPQESGPGVPLSQHIGPLPNLPKALAKV